MLIQQIPPGPRPESKLLSKQALPVAFHRKPNVFTEHILNSMCLILKALGHIHFTSQVASCTSPLTWTATKATKGEKRGKLFGRAVHRCSSKRKHTVEKHRKTDNFSFLLICFLDFMPNIYSSVGTSGYPRVGSISPGKPELTGEMPDFRNG